ncbi:MAG: M23 family metallopeptidase [Rhizobacter sp.]|nr:M23 family metallopeptidase [Chlorobiales bacterium]
MNRFLSCLLFLLITLPRQSWAQPSADSVTAPVCLPCARFDSLAKKIRDGLVAKSDAQNAIRTLVPEIKTYALEKGLNPASRAAWRFPVEGYEASFIGGKNGSGYKPRQYDYLDGNVHKAHPAHDIFIFDRNQDCLDDNTGKSVRILSMSSGIVVARTAAWDTASNLRGGKVVCVFDTETNGMFYYAHLNTVDVELGDVVSAGTPLGEMGRTGINAFKRRSPTHLHISYLKVEDGYPRPENIYRDLVKAKTK